MSQGVPEQNPAAVEHAQTPCWQWALLTDRWASMGHPGAPHQHGNHVCWSGSTCARSCSLGMGAGGTFSLWEHGLGWLTPSPAERGCPGGTEQAQRWSLPPSSWVPVLLGLAPPCPPWVTGDYLLPLRMRMVMWALRGRKNGDSWIWCCNTARCPGCRTHRRLPGCFHSVVSHTAWRQ